MEPSPNGSKRRKGVQSECQISEETENADPLGNTDPNADFGPEPNFNINLNLASPRNPRLTTDTSKLQGQKGGRKPGAKVALILETRRSTSTLASPEMSPGERDDPLLQRSRIPALSRSPTAEVLGSSEQRFTSPNLKPTATTTAVSPKPPRVGPTTIASSPRTTERVKTQEPRTESASVSSPKPQTTKTTHKLTVGIKMQSNRKEDGQKEMNLEMPKTLQLPVSVLNQKGGSKVISPKLANRTPTLAAKIPKPEPASSKVNEKTGHDSRSSGTPPAGPKCHNEKSEEVLLSAKTPQTSSLSPKPSTQRKASGTRNSKESGSKENLDGRDSSLCSGSKTSSKSSSTTTTRDSLESKTGPNSKSSPNSETAMGSKDSLDSKGGSVSKTSLGSKDSLDSKTGSTSKASPNCKSRTGSRDSLDSKTESKARKTTPELKISKVHSVGSLSPSSSRTGSKDDNLKTTSVSAKPSPVPKAGLDSSKPGPVRSSSKSALADLSSSLALSPRPGSASRSPGSGPSKRISSLGPNRDVQRSPGSAPGSGPLAPLGTSSPETTESDGSTSDPAAGSVAVETPHNTSLNRGLTFDSITKTSATRGATDEKEHLKPPETIVTPAGGLMVSQGAGRGVDVTDKVGRSPSAPLSKPGHPRDTNAINIPSSRATEKHPSTCPASFKAVRDSATMTETLQEQREVGVQVEVVQCDAPASSLIGSPSCQSGSLTSPTVPSLCCIPAGPPPLQHICKIDIELRSQSLLPSAVTDRAGSLPACLRTYSFQQTPGLTPNRQNQDVSAESIWEDKEEEKVSTEQNQEATGMEDWLKPQKVVWDKQGMTWEVYGASVDLECLGTAIQSHLESKIREQQKHISTLRKSICSGSGLRGFRMKKRRRGGILGCCGKAPAVAD